MESAAGRFVAQQSIDHGGCQLLHHVTHTRAGRFLPTIDGDKRLGHGYGDLVGFERAHGAIATNNFVIRIARFGRIGI